MWSDYLSDVDISAYIPIVNQARWAERVEIPSGMGAIVFDNASSDSTAQVFRSRGVPVSESTTSLGRIGNWDRAVEAFRSSDGQWLKWLFAGDSLLPDAHERISAAAEAFPTARMLVFEYEIREGGVRRPWSMFSSTRLLDPPSTLHAAAALGNWFGAPVSTCIRRDGLTQGWDFGVFPWVADFHFALSIAEHFPVLYVAESIGTFNADERAFYSGHALTPRASLEEALVRLDAADRFLAATGDTKEHRRLQRVIQRSLLGSLTGRAALKALGSGSRGSARRARLISLARRWK